RTHRLQREVADDGMDQRRVRPPGELAEAAVVDARAEVVRVADHRGAGRAGDGRLDLAFHGRERPLDDLQEDRVRHSLHGSFQGLTPFGGSQPLHAPASLVTPVARPSLPTLLSPADARLLTVSKASLRSALTAALRAGVRGDDEVAVAVEFRGEARVQRARRAELLDDGGAPDRLAGGEPLPPVDGRVLPAVEVDGPRAGAGARRVAVPLRALRQAGPGDRADAGDAQVDPLDGVARV